MTLHAPWLQRCRVVDDDGRIVDRPGSRVEALMRCFCFRVGDAMTTRNVRLPLPKGKHIGRAAVNGEARLILVDIL